MRKKLLNINNLIIILALVIFFISIPTNVFAAEVSINKFLKIQIAGWYEIIRNVSLSVMFILLVVAGIRMHFAALAEDKAILKKAMPTWIAGLIILLTIHYAMYFLIDLNQTLVNSSKDLGRQISGVNEFGEENTLYETAKSKAYEPKFTSGTLGMIMYMMLVFYTYKFVLVYAKRYFNVIILVLIAPILCIVSVFRKVFSGKNEGELRKWIKEFIYNVFLQALHAFFYASLIGLTLKLSERLESFIGAILALIVFGFIFSLDGLIRKLFNFVGGSTSIKKRDIFGGIKSSAMAGYKAMSGEGTFGEKIGSMASSVKNSIKDSVSEKLDPENIRKGLVKFKDNAIYEAKETIAALDGKRVKVTEEQIRREQEKIDNPNLAGKALNIFQKGVYGVGEIGTKSIGKIKNRIKRSMEDLDQNYEMTKRLKRVLRSHNRKRSENLEPYDTSLNLSTSPKDVADELKKSIEMYGKDLLVAVYSVEGPQAFIHPEIGSPYMGMSVLASENYETHYASLYTEDSKKRSIRLNLKRKRSKVKRYKFVRFNGESVKTITYGLNRRLILNSKYLTSLNRVATMVNLGSLELKDISGIEKTTIKYTAKVNSAVEKKHTADIELEKYEEREQDSRWAALTTVSMDVRTFKTNRMMAEISQMMEQPASSIEVEQLVDMGKAVKLDENTAIIFEEVDKSVKMSKESSLEVMTSAVIMDTAIKFGVANIEQMDFQDEEVKTQLLDELVKKGIVNANVKKNKETRREVLDSMEKIKQLITQEEYSKAVARQEITEIYEKDTDPDKVKEEIVEIHLKNLSQLVWDIAKETVKLEAKELKNELSSRALESKEDSEFAEESSGSESKTRFKDKGKRAKSYSSSEESEQKPIDNSKDTYIVYIHGAVINEGRYDVEEGTRIYEVIKLAGGLTDDADLTAISTYDAVFDGQTIFIPSINDDEEFEKILERCRPIVEEVVKEYLIENNITNIETLRKLVHKNMIISKLKKALKDENLNKEQIEVLLEERIKEIKAIRNFFEDIASEARIVKIGNMEISEDDKNIINEKERRKLAIENKQEEELDEMIKQVAKGDSDTEKGSDEELKRLLEEMRNDAEKVLINRNSNDEEKQNLRTMYINQSPEDRMNFLLGRF